MKIGYLLVVAAAFIVFESCSSSRKSAAPRKVKDTEIKSRVVIKKKVPAKTINTKGIAAEELVVFAESLQGVPYRYGSIDVKRGFDCSGFITYVFNHYGISVPRTSSDFTNAGSEVSMKDCKRGDIILFTGSDPNSGVVGHMGIITRNSGGIINFIHSASGGGRGVMISGMSDYFVTRFVKVIRIFSIFE